MKKKVMILGLALAAFTACQQNDEIGLNPGVTEINPADLPSSSQSFIDTNFEGEVVANAYKVTGTDNMVTYEAFMSNNTNLVFHEKSELVGFGNINSRMEMEGEMFDGGMQNMGMFGNGNMMGNGSGGMMSGGMMGDGSGSMLGDGDHEFRDHPDAMPDEMEISDLPTDIMSYLNDNYPDMEILMAFEIGLDDELAEYHVLIQDIGGMIFDKDGDFMDMIRRGMGHCEDYSELDIEDLPENILEYVESHYPDDNILRVRMGSNDNYKEIQVMMEDAGIMIFDTNGKFIKLMERRRSHHG